MVYFGGGKVPLYIRFQLGNSFGNAKVVFFSLNIKIIINVCIPLNKVINYSEIFCAPLT